MNSQLKKILWIIACIIFSNNYNSYAQLNGEATYSVESIFSFGKEKNKNVDSVLKQITEQSKNTDKIELKLIFNKNESLFYYEDALETDDNNMFNLTLIFAKTIGKYYVNNINNQVLHKKELRDGTKVIIKKKSNDYNWDLKNEIKTIGKYTCYKAVYSKKYIKNNETKVKIVEAWYAPEIPVNSGPIGYRGLPGLILELKDGKNFSYYLTKISFNTKNSINIKKPKKGKMMTPEEYKEVMKKAKEEFYKSRG